MDEKLLSAPYEMPDIPMTPEMLEAAVRRLEAVGSASATYLAEEVFQAALKVALRQGVLLLPKALP
jgi:hypothetical protein